MRLSTPCPRPPRGTGRLTALALVAVLAACGEPPEGIEPAGGPPLDERQIGAAIQKILEPSEPVPMPPISVTTDPDVVRLDQRLERAAVVSDWLPAEGEQATLVSFGPADSRRPGDGVRVERKQARASHVQWLVLPAFRVRADEVGEIVLEGEFGTAESFLISWSNWGFTELPVRSGGAVERYSVRTDGLPDFKDILKTIRVGVYTDAGAGAYVALERLELRSRSAAHPDAAGTARIRMGGVIRSALYLHGGTRVTFEDLEVPAGARLSFGAAVIDQPLRLAVTVSTPDGVRRLQEQGIPSGEAWQESNLSLENPGPATVDLTLVANGPSDRVVVLGSPTVYRPVASPPRVFVYLIDTLGAKHTSLHGYGRDTTPFLDRLASEGAWFANAFANSPWTRESVPSLMTSMLSRSHGVLDDFSRLADDYLTLAEAYAAAGYATASFSTNSNAGPARAMDQGFDSFFDHIARVRAVGALRTVPVPPLFNWLRQHRDRPTLVYIHTAEPHDPYEPPPPYDTMYDPEYQGSVDGRWRPTRNAFLRGRLDPADLAHLEALYDGEVAFADRMLEAFFDLAGEEGYLDDAIVAVTSDHGEAFGEHALFGHGLQLYPELVHIPTVLWSPGRIRPGRHEANVQLLDLLPTLLDLSGIEVEAPFQGISLTETIRGRRQPELDERALLLAVNTPRSPRLSIVEGRFKLDLDTTLRFEPHLGLYDLAADPMALEDLAERQPKRALELLERLVRDYRQLPRYDAGLSTDYEITQEQIDRLKALGYL